MFFSVKAETHLSLNKMTSFTDLKLQNFGAVILGEIFWLGKMLPISFRSGRFMIYKRTKLRFNHA